MAITVVKAGHTSHLNPLPLTRDLTLAYRASLGIAFVMTVASVAGLLDSARFYPGLDAMLLPLFVGQDPHTVVILDLTVQLPALLVGGVLLWRRAPLGYVVAAGLLLQAGAYLIGLSVLTLGQEMLTHTPFDPTAIVPGLVVGALCLALLAFFVRGTARALPTHTLLPPPGGGVGVAPAGVARDPLPEFRAGDIILFAGRNDWYGRLSRWGMRTAGESPTYAVHTAQFIAADRYLELDIVGKLRTTSEILRPRQMHDTWQRRGFEVWRCLALTGAQQEALAQQALAYLGARFSFAKFLTHLLDGLINKVLGREVFVFRRLNHDQRYPICSWITAFSYDRALHYQFGASPECADPDQIDDWVRAHPDEWVCVFRLEYA